MLSRLSDRYEEGQDGKRIRIIRYGLGGISAEIEKRGRKWFVVHPNKKEKNFKTLAECEVYMEELRRNR